MTPDGNQIIGENYRWVAATSEIEDVRDGSRRQILRLMDELKKNL